MYSYRSSGEDYDTYVCLNCLLSKCLSPELIIALIIPKGQIFYRIKAQTKYEAWQYKYANLCHIVTLTAFKKSKRL